MNIKDIIKDKNLGHIMTFDLRYEVDIKLLYYAIIILRFMMRMFWTWKLLMSL